MKNDELFIKSALTTSNTLNSLDFILSWIKDKNNEVDVQIDLIRFDEMNQWHLDRKEGVLLHNTGKFFSIEGINISTNWGKISEWDQPIINQPEIGYLGIITKEISGILYFLLPVFLSTYSWFCESRTLIFIFL